MTDKQLVLSIFPRAYLQGAGSGYWNVLVRKREGVPCVPAQLGLGYGEDAAWANALKNIRMYGDMK